MFILEDSTDLEEEDKEYREYRTYLFVQMLLQDKDEILFYRTQIQHNIWAFKETYMYNGKKALDYAMNGQYNHADQERDVNAVLSGERWFMYTMFQLIYSKDKRYEKYFNMFYAYLVIKETIRSELVQTNANIGFDNFARYQDRKEDFIEDTPFEKPYIEMAVKGTLQNQNILHLEARIAPKNSPDENRDYIKKFDRMLGNDPELQKRYFYVFHFIKEKENRKEQGSDILCRHFKKRKSLQVQARAIAAFRERYPKEAQRVHGTDITITLVRERKPVKLLEQLGNKYAIVKSGGGIYQVDGMLFPMQIVVTGELEEDAHIWLKSLTREMGQAGAEVLLGHCDSLHADDVAYNQAKSVVSLVTDVNKELFKRITMGGGKVSDELKYMILPELAEKDVEIAESKKAIAEKDAELIKTNAELAESKKEIERLRRELAAAKA